MRRGPKPKPAYLKVVTGNPGKRPIQEWVKPAKRSRVMAPPAHLNRTAKTEWRRLAKAMTLAGTLSDMDRGAFTAWCETWSTYVIAQKAIDALARDSEDGLGGMILTTKAGNAIQHPLVGIRNKALRDLVRVGAEFGFTPSARSRVQDVAPGAAAKKAREPSDFFDDD